MTTKHFSAPKTKWKNWCYGCSPCNTPRFRWTNPPRHPADLPSPTSRWTNLPTNRPSEKSWRPILFSLWSQIFICHSSFVILHSSLTFGRACSRLGKFKRAWLSSRLIAAFVIRHPQRSPSGGSGASTLPFRGLGGYTLVRWRLHLAASRFDAWCVVFWCCKCMTSPLRFSNVRGSFSNFFSWVGHLVILVKIVISQNHFWKPKWPHYI